MDGASSTGKLSSLAAFPLQKQTLSSASIAAVSMCSRMREGREEGGEGGGEGKGRGERGGGKEGREKGGEREEGEEVLEEK